MPTTALSLPIDVSWKRLAISQDMYAPSIGAALPEKWRSSLAVFFYQPDPDPADTTGEITTFLKLVGSITGYNYDHLILIGEKKGDLAAGLAPIKIEIATTYYPALCAICQIAVFPGEGNWTVEQFPYFTDFQPKQREIIETKTDTGEFVTTSTEPLNVKKSTTTMDDQETLPYKAGQPTTVTKSGTATETLFTDASRERRETTSYSSNLAQLYQILDSYHSGTNRAVFLTVARPHLVDSVYTFVNGPRRLEGVQEFFLVVRRPKEMADICVKALLDTAHLDVSDTPGDPATMFTTARAVSGCTGGGGTHILPAGPFVTHEQQLSASFNDLVAASSKFGAQGVAAANALSRGVRDMFVASFREGMRYQFGTVNFLDTKFAQRKLIANISAEQQAARPRLLQAVRAAETTLTEPSGQPSKASLAARQRLVRELGIRTQPTEAEAPAQTESK